jgi:hypothetical protein
MTPPKIDRNEYFVGWVVLSGPELKDVLACLGVVFRSQRDEKYYVRMKGDVLEKIWPLWGKVKWELEVEDLEYQAEKRRGR